MEWINRNDKMPEEGQFISAIRIKSPKFYWIGYYGGFNSFSINAEDQFDYWLPTPEPPEKEKWINPKR